MMTGTVSRSIAWYSRDDQHAHAAGHSAYQKVPIRPDSPSQRVVGLAVAELLHCFFMYFCSQVRVPGLHAHTCLLPRLSGGASWIVAGQGTSLPQYEPEKPKLYLGDSTTCSHRRGGRYGKGPNDSGTAPNCGIAMSKWFCQPNIL